MISRILLEIARIFMAAFDACHTQRKIEQYGVQIELNPFVRFLCKRTEIAGGVNLGVYIPTLFWAVGGWYYPAALAFVVGTRFTLFLFQQQERLHNG